MDFDLNKSIQELENDDWGDPERGETALIQDCLWLRRIPLKDFEEEQIGRMIRQQIGVQYLIPMALEILRNDPLADCFLYEGCLLKSVMESSSDYWEKNPEHKEEIIQIYHKVLAENSNELEESDIGVLKNAYLVLTEFGSYKTRLWQLEIINGKYSGFWLEILSIIAARQPISQNEIESLSRNNILLEPLQSMLKARLVVKSGSFFSLAPKMNNALKLDAVAQNLIGCRYLYDVKDEKTAFGWFEKAANQGYDEAQNNLGYCYENSIGTKKDVKKAFQVYWKSAEQGNPAAECHLGLCYRDGIGVDKDDKEAFKWLLLSSSKNNAVAIANLGVCYQHGIGVEVDEKKAFHLYSDAVALGFYGARNNLAFCYQHGIGISRDETHAVSIYQKAAEDGDYVAEFNLGYCYENGIGVEQEEALAIEWYTKAAEKGYLRASERLLSIKRNKKLQELKNFDLNGLWNIIDDSNLEILGNKFPNLEEIDLSACEGITDVVLALFLEKHPNLKNVKLRWCKKITDQGLFAIAEKCPHLIYLDVSYCQEITDKGIASILARCEYLIGLSLINCKKIIDLGLMAFKDKPLKLKSVDLWCCKNLADRSLFLLLESCPSLMAINLKECQEVTGNSLASLKKQYPNIIRVDFEGCSSMTGEGIARLAEHCPNLSSLSMMNCKKVTDIGPVTLLNYCIMPESLNLSGCKEISGEGFSSLSRSHPTLKELNLRGCNITDKGLVTLLDQFSNLRTLSLDNAAILGRDIEYRNRRYGQLHELTLYGFMELTDEGLQTIGSIFPNLLSIYISGCKKVTDRGLTLFFNKPHKIKQFELTSYMNTFEGFGPLTDKVYNLEELNLSNCCNLTDEGLRKVVVNFPNLSSLFLNCCYLITDESLYFLIENCLNLKYLDIDRCRKISNSAIDYITAKYPKLYLKVD